MEKHKESMWFEPFEQFEREWNQRAQEAAKKFPINQAKNPPKMSSITPDTLKGLRFKSLKWMIFKDHHGDILKSFLKHPFKYGIRFLRSILMGKPYIREGDFFLYGLNSIEELHKKLNNKDSFFVIGFSYCHKPFECPSKRFSDQCCASPDNPVCNQCFIGKMCQATSQDNTVLLFIPTVHYISKKILDLVEAHPHKDIVFLITTCEMALEMFGDFSRMVHICGAGVKLEGRPCNTMKAFELSEQGIKPGLTSVSPENQQIMLELIRTRNQSFIST